MKRFAPATERNREAIAAVLADELPGRGRVLEVASGTGEHAVYFAGRFPALEWQPSDPDAEAIASIAAWRDDAGLANLQAPVLLDAAATRWPLDAADAVLCVNMVHISPTKATEGLFAGAKRVLPSGAPILLYGPYLEEGVETALSNVSFDASLKARDPRWGLRDTGWVDAIASNNGFGRARRAQMPANNIMLIYRR